MAPGYGSTRALAWVGAVPTQYGRAGRHRSFGFARAALVAALGVLGVATVATIAPPRAAAFCRESLSSQAQGPCEPEPGVPFLFWKAPRNCVTYRFNDQFWNRIPLLSETAIRNAFSASFETWSSVTCSGRTGDVPFKVEQFSGTTTTQGTEFLYDAVNESVVVARTRAEWQSMEGHDDNALALTLLWHDKNTGEILDVDMEINTGAGRFTDCEKQRCTLNNIDLQNTVTHEAGHLLGLGHSPVPGSTMEASTQTNPETSKRTLDDDDLAGYCALDLPEFDCKDSACTCPDPPVVALRSKVRSCGCRAIGTREPHAGSGLAWLSALGAMFGARQARRRRRPLPLR